MNLWKRSVGMIPAAAVSFGLWGVVPVSEMERGMTASAANADYAVQAFRLGIGDTDRNVNASGTADGDSLNSATITGADSEKWTLNYISAGVYEIVNVQTGYVITNHSSEFG